MGSEESQPPKRNCWSCKHDLPGGVCYLLDGGSGEAQQSPMSRAIWARLQTRNTDENAMPDKSADGCPGYAATEEATP